VIDHAGNYRQLQLGAAPENGAWFQAVMPAGVWFAAEPAPETEFTLAGCTVSPGFDFRDFEMAKKETLLRQHPTHRAVIERLCR
jgi:hypothetical protein